MLIGKMYGIYKLVCMYHKIELFTHAHSTIILKNRIAIKELIYTKPKKKKKFCDFCDH